MKLRREDFFPYYREDLMKKAERVRQVIVNLPKYCIPEVSDVSEAEYDLIRLAIINSIKGEAIAKEEGSRQRFVENVYLAPSKQMGLLNYEDVSGRSKCDFEGDFTDGAHFGLEVKGGEGNSVTLLNRPSEADIFIVWSHLDVMSNTPADNMRAVIGRVVKQMINEDERRQKVDFLVFYDEWYRSGVKIFRSGITLPDIIIFPTTIPTKRNPHPSLPNIKDHPFVKSLMKIVGKMEDLDNPTVKMHIWYCDIELLQQDKGWIRKMAVFNNLDSNVTLTKQRFTNTPCKPIA